MTDEPTWDTVRTALSEARNYWICTVRPDGRPHAVPVWGVWWRGCVVFSTIGFSVKAANLRANRNAGVHLESAHNVVTVDGLAAEVADRAELAEIGPLFDAKYGELTGVTYDLVESHTAGMTIFAVRPEVVRSWSAEDMMNSSRFTFAADGTAVAAKPVAFEFEAEETKSVR